MNVKTEDLLAQIEALKASNATLTEKAKRAKRANFIDLYADYIGREPRTEEESADYIARNFTLAQRTNLVKYVTPIFDVVARVRAEKDAELNALKIAHRTALKAAKAPPKAAKAPPKADGNETSKSAKAA